MTTAPNGQGAAPEAARDGTAALSRIAPTIPRLTPRHPSTRRKFLDAAVEARPETPALPPPPDLTGWSYSRPRRYIVSPEDHELFLRSPAYTLVTGFIFSLTDSVRDRPVSTLRADEQLAIVKAIVEVLVEAHELLSTHPPEKTQSRFGNPAFRSYVDSVRAALPRWHRDKLGLRDDGLIAEVSTYLARALGSRARIDYGSGHELNFALWLLCLWRAAVVPASSFAALGLLVFPAYLRLVRAVQTTYYLEPAGSHGVWGLDDYQFLPFLLGASQLASGHAYITPRAIHSALTLEEAADDYLYLDQVRFVNRVKNVDGLRWHSPMLDDISAAKSWAKIEAGMRKVFVKEILGKRTVMQHFLFGSLVPAADGMSGALKDGEAESDDEDVAGAGDESGHSGEVQVFRDQQGKKHIHSPVGWSDCCGIRVPGSVGAAGERAKAEGRGLRRVPFD